MTKIEADNIKQFCLDYLKLRHDKVVRAKKRNSKNADWNDGIFEGSRTSLGDLINYINTLVKEDF